MTGMSDRQAAQQRNRDDSGRYTEKTGADPGEVDLEPREFIGNPTKPWSEIPRDYRMVNDDGVRMVLANIEGVGTCLVPWKGPSGNLSAHTPSHPRHLACGQGVGTTRTSLGT